MILISCSEKGCGGTAFHFVADIEINSHSTQMDDKERKDEEARRTTEHQHEIIHHFSRIHSRRDDCIAQEIGEDDGEAPRRVK